MTMNLVLKRTRIGLIGLGCGILAGLHVAGADSAPAQLTPPPGPGSTYRLSPNDVLRVKVFQEDDLTTEIRLGKDGSATFPLLGVINLGGKTVDEAAAAI